VDILTGEMFIVRADIIEDAGLSTSPQVKYSFLPGQTLGKHKKRICVIYNMYIIMLWYGINSD